MALKQKSKKASTSSVETEPALKKGKKAAKVTEEVTEVEVGEKELPSVEDSPELKKIAEASKEAEKKVDKKTKKAAKEAESEADKKKSFLSISNTTQDGETPKVPSYSAAKNRGVVYIRWDIDLSAKVDDTN